MRRNALPLLSLVCLAVVAIAAAPGHSLARPPTRGRFQLGAGAAYTDPFDNRTPDPWQWGLAARTGFTLNSGLYIGGLADFHFGEDSQEGTITYDSSSLMVGGVLGIDLKLSQTVTGRLAAVGGLHRLTTAVEPEGSVEFSSHQEDFFFGPMLELVLMLGDHLYLGPAARANFVLQDDLLTIITWSATFGLLL